MWCGDYPGGRSLEGLAAPMLAAFAGDPGLIRCANPSGDHPLHTPVFHPNRALGACSLVALAAALSFAPAAQAAKQKVCVFDILGTAGAGATPSGPPRRPPASSTP